MRRISVLPSTTDNRSKHVCSGRVDGLREDKPIKMAGNLFSLKVSRYVKEQDDSQEAV